MENTGLTRNLDFTKDSRVKVVVGVSSKFFKNQSFETLLRCAKLGRNLELRLGLFIVVCGPKDELEARLDKYNIYYNDWYEGDVSKADFLDYLLEQGESRGITPNVESLGRPVKMFAGFNFGAEELLKFLVLICTSRISLEDVGVVTRLFLLNSQR